MSTAKSPPPLLKSCDVHPEPTVATAPALSKFYQAPLQWTGFTKVSNLVLFSLTAGMFALFSAFQTITLPEGHRMKPNPPGPHFWFSKGLMYLVMRIHLASVIPAGIFLPLQFLPVMRRRYMYLHRVSGRALLVLLLFGNITALAMAKYSFGGTITTQVWVVAVACLTTFSVYKAWSSILNLRIDQHRVWVLRTWSYTCTILSLRIFMFIFAISAAKISPNAYKSVITCEQLIFMYRSVMNSESVDSLYARYPVCAGLDGAGSDVYAIVNVSLSKVYPEERAVMMNMIFGVSGWTALVVHILLTEVYLHYSKDEDGRLKRVSIMRSNAARIDKNSKSKWGKTGRQRAI